MFNKLRKGKKVDLKPQEPRAYSEIEAEAGQVTFNVGRVQYQVFVYQEELTRLQEQLKKLNHEGAVSKAWDEAKRVKAEEEKKQAEGALA